MNAMMIIRADPGDDQRQTVHDQHHRRHHDRHDTVCGHVILGDLFVCLLKFFLLIILCVIRADNAQTGQVLARDAVDVIGQDLDLLESRMCEQEAYRQHDQDQNDRNARREGPFHAFVGDLEDAEDRHQRRAHDDEQSHDDHHLHLCDIVGRAGDQRRGRKAVDLCHREGFDRVIELCADVVGVARREKAGDHRDQYRHQHARERAEQHLASRDQDIVDLRARNDDQRRDVLHVLGHQQLEPYGQRDQYHRARDGDPVAFCKVSYKRKHYFTSCLR